MGGWEEECYYSLFRVALCEIQKESPWTVVQQKFLDAYDYRPCRAEPLHAIARFLRMNGRPRAAYLFAKEAATIPYPQHDILFIDNNIYEWMALDELGSTAFYVHNYQLGAYACDKLLRDGKLPQSEAERVSKNFAAYKERLAQTGQQMPQTQQKAPSVPVINLQPTQSLLTGLTSINKKDKKRRK